MWQHLVSQCNQNSEIKNSTTLTALRVRNGLILFFCYQNSEIKNSTTLTALRVRDGLILFFCYEWLNANKKYMWRKGFLTSDEIKDVLDRWVE